jgi:hypothetical protein
MNYLKIGKAVELEGKDRTIYRIFEILPAFLSVGTLLILIILSYYQPIFVAYFIILFDIYWLLLVIYLSIHLFYAYNRMIKNIKIDWGEKCRAQTGWEEIIHLVIFPTYNETAEVIMPSFQALINDGYPTEKMIVVLATEEREGESAARKADIIKKNFGDKFRNFLVTIHPDNIQGELKGKGANQAWAAKIVKEQLIDKENLDYGKIMVSVFDIDTIINKGFFYRLTHAFLTVEDPYHASYQPIPVYHNNVWRAPFFARVAAASNTFWQMMQQIRSEKLATYSSHSMTWRALNEIGFWSTTMVSEDSRIFWHCFCHYRGNYRVEPLYFPVSMDVTMDSSLIQTALNLYKQQRRWGWGAENIPYLIFNTYKNWTIYPKKFFLNRIFIQLYGFHSWATNALIIGAIGWLPMLLGGDKFNSSVLSNNLPVVTRTLMTVAMFGLVFSAIISSRLLPPRPAGTSIFKSASMLLQWLILPVSIIVFGTIPGLEAQIRLALGKYLGFWVTPKTR